jgi:hypothetical protein
VDQKHDTEANEDKGQDDVETESRQSNSLDLIECVLRVGRESGTRGLEVREIGAPRTCYKEVLSRSELKKQCISTTSGFVVK